MTGGRNPSSQRWAVFSSETFAVICSAVRRASASIEARSSRITPTPEATIAEVAMTPTGPPTPKPAPGELRALRDRVELRDRPPPVGAHLEHQ